MDHPQRKEILQAIALIVICLQFLYVVPLNAQQQSRSRTEKRNKLMQFSKVKAVAWELDQKRIDSLAALNPIPLRYQEYNKRIVELQRLGYHNRPVYYATDNADAARIISVDKLWIGEGDLPSLTGEGEEINLWDGGSVLGSHREFEIEGGSRIIMRDLDIPESNHATHVAGTMAAAGIDEDARGMAGMATVYSWDYSNDITEMAIAALEGIVVSNHSYGPLCGWYYNSNNENWYWYGDPELSEEEDYRFGFYDEESADMDYIAWCAPNYLIVKSAGNDRNDVPENQPIEHLVWDETWTPVTAEREPDGGEDGYDCLTPMAVPKNILTVGAVDDNRLISSFSAFGPTDDGRIKPDVMTNGTDVYSSIASSEHSYEYINGTSMSAASASGSISLLNQLQKMLQPGVDLLSSTMKGLLIHTADEAGTSAGPDYRHGWGILNIKGAAELMQLNSGNGGRNICEGIIIDGETVTIPVTIAGPSPGIKITLCWTDPPGEYSEPLLNPEEAKLVNDLNLELGLPDNQTSCYPWVLDAAHPEAPATQGVNHVDNVEQLFLSDPVTGIYQVSISHSGSLADGIQSYSLIISGITTPADILPPRLLQYISGSSSVELKWTSARPGLPSYYRIYRNDVLLAETADTAYTDLDVIAENEYDYYVTAVYEWGGEEAESLGTNTIIVTPRVLRPIPYIVDFEDGYSDLLIKNNSDGWRWGDSELLSSYYVKFEDNTTHFIGIDSYSTGESSHVHDVAATLPLKLAGCSNVTISFDYMLLSGIYYAIDELHVVYKMQEEVEWHKLEQITRVLNWTHYSLSLPDGLCKDGLQIGFYYDDFYQWGMGAGLDNISISGEVSRSIDLAITSMISPVSACTLSAAEPVSIAILNAGEEDALQGDIITLQMDFSTGVQIEEELVLSETLHSGEQLIYQMGTLVDLSELGTYTFSFLLSSDLDNSVQNNSFTSMVEVRGNPDVQILNSDLLFCEEDPPVLIQCSPVGGTLSGTGVYGLFFDPGAAGAGAHTISYVFTDPFGCTGSASAVLEVVAQPKPIIVNEDLSFCEDESSVLIQAIPEGGILTGPGITGLYFDPQNAGIGRFPIEYKVIYRGECSASTSRDFFVVEKPVVDLGSDRQVELDDTIELMPTGNGASYLWFDASTDNSLLIIANDLGIGNHDIWVEAFSPEKCKSVDSMLLTVEEVSGIQLREDAYHPIVYPNPFSTGFYLEVHENEKVEKISIHDLTGRIHSMHIPDSNPYFHVPDLPAGSYFLKVETRDKVYVIRMVKI